MLFLHIPERERERERERGEGIKTIFPTYFEHTYRLASQRTYKAQPNPELTISPEKERKRERERERSIKL